MSPLQQALQAAAAGLRHVGRALADTAASVANYLATLASNISAAL